MCFHIASDPPDLPPLVCIVCDLQVTLGGTDYATPVCMCVCDTGTETETDTETDTEVDTEADTDTESDIE